MLTHTHTHARCAREFPGSLVVRILSFLSCGLGLVPGLGTEIPQVRGVAKKKYKLSQQCDMATKEESGV